MKSRSAASGSPPAAAPAESPDTGAADRPRDAGWHLTPRAFGAFLDALHPERDVSAEHYERLRAKLIRFFEWRGSSAPDERADDTLTRVMRKLDEGTPIDDVPTYCYGVARMVLLEARKQQQRQAETLSQIPPPPLGDDSELERRLECLRSCMSGLAGDHQRLIEEYHRHDGRERIAGRQRLADSLGIRLNALRIRVHRLTERLSTCVRTCAARHEA